MDYMYSEEGSTLTSWGVEKEHYTIDKGVKVVKKEWIDRFSGMGDPWRAYQAFIGTGSLAISPYFDNYSMFFFIPDDQKKMYEFWGNDKFTKNFQYLPTLSTKESDRLVQVQSKVDTILDTEVSKFIMGLRPLREFDQFVKDLVDAGALEIEQLSAAAYARVD